MSATLISELQECPPLKENRRATSSDAHSAALPPLSADDRTFFGLIELLLKAPQRVDDLVRVSGRQPEFIQRFLAIALASLSLFGVGLTILLTTTPSVAMPSFMMPYWRTRPWGSGAALWLAYTLGFTLATGVCLPSFYFYALLAGVKVSILQVTALIMKGKSETCLMLMGILPIYLAIVLGAIVFHVPDEWLRWAIWLGLCLPFIAGFWGLRGIYQGFLGLADTIDEWRRCDRLCYLRRLTLACTLCYAAVAPVMIYTLWKYVVVWGA